MGSSEAGVLQDMTMSSMTSSQWEDGLEWEFATGLADGRLPSLPATPTNPPPPPPTPQTPLPH